jgi:hypothetical protein
MDLLGAAWSEQELLSLGYSIERVQKLRRAPFSTPALVGGKPPGIRAVNIDLAAAAGFVLTLSYEETASRMQYTMKPSGATLSRLTAVWIHAGTPDAPGAARHMIWRQGDSFTGSLNVTAADRRDIAERRWLVRAYLLPVAGSGDVHAAGVTFPR